jgi:hypothetical protein
MKEGEMAVQQDGAESEISFEAFLNGSKQFCRAADSLLGLRRSKDDSLDPVYLLYFHSTELALKAFMRFRGKKTSELKTDWRHNLEKLHADAIVCGLAPEPADAFELSNVVNLLHSGNKGEAFRYFTLESRVMPDIAWASTIVNAVIRLVERRTGYAQTKSRSAVKLDLIVGPPLKKSSDE